MGRYRHRPGLSSQLGGSRHLATELKGKVERLVEAVESEVRPGRRIPVPTGSDPGSIAGHADQQPTDPPEDEPTWTNAGSPTAL